jgi:hypothetical protein
MMRTGYREQRTENRERRTWLALVRLICGVSQFSHIEEVLVPSACELIADEILSGDHVGSDLTIDKAFDSILPGFVKADSVDVLEKVDACRRLADLESGSVHEVLWGQAGQRRAILGECAEDGETVVPVGLDEDIQIFGGSRLRVNAECITTHDQVPNGVVVEGA